MKPMYFRKTFVEKDISVVLLLSLTFSIRIQTPDHDFSNFEVYKCTRETRALKTIFVLNNWE